MRKGIRYIFYTKLSHNNYTKFNIKKCERPFLKKKQRLIKNQSYFFLNYLNRIQLFFLSVNVFINLSTTILTLFLLNYNLLNYGNMFNIKKFKSPGNL